LTPDDSEAKIENKGKVILEKVGQLERVKEFGIVSFFQ